MSRFPLIDQYLGVLLDIPIAEIAPGEMHIVESDRRLRCEQSYGYIHALFGIWFADGRVAVSVPPGAIQSVEEVLGKGKRPSFPDQPGRIERLVASVNPSLARAGLSPVKHMQVCHYYACSASTLRRWNTGQCRRINSEDIPPAEGLSLPYHCFPDGIVYGVVEEGRIVSVAIAHRSGILEGQVADLAVETAPAYRLRGYAKTVVSAVTAHLTERGGEGLYNCSPTNQASIATALSVGYEFYGNALIIKASVA